MPLFNNYAKPGKGVDKDVYESRFKVFFDVLYRKFWKMMQLNLLYCVFSIPLIVVFMLFVPAGQSEANTVTNYLYCIGALLYLSVVGLGFVIPGFTYILRNYSNEQHAFLFSDFWDTIKENFKQGLLLFILDTVLLVVFYLSISFYMVLPDQSAGVQFAKWFLICMALLYFLMHFYIYQIMVTFAMSLGQILKNALILTLGHLPRNLLVFVVVAAIAVITFSISVQMGLLFSGLISVALIGYVVNFTSLDIVKKYMIDQSEVEKILDEE